MKTIPKSKLILTLILLFLLANVSISKKTKQISEPQEPSEQEPQNSENTNQEPSEQSNNDQNNTEEQSQENSQQQENQTETDEEEQQDEEDQQQQQTNSEQNNTDQQENSEQNSQQQEDNNNNEDDDELSEQPNPQDLDISALEESEQISDEEEEGDQEQQQQSENSEQQEEQEQENSEQQKFLEKEQEGPHKEASERSPQQQEESEENDDDEQQKENPYEILQEWEKHLDDFNPQELLTFQIQKHNSEQFFEEIQEKTSLKGAFFVAEESSNPIDFKIIAPNNEILYKKLHSSDGIFFIQANQTGNYTFEFESKKSSKDLYVTFALDNHLAKKDGHVKHHSITSLNETLDDYHQEISNIFMENRFGQRMEKSHLKYVQNTHKKLLMQAVFEVLAILGASCWQVYYIKKILENKSIV